MTRFMSYTLRYFHIYGPNSDTTFQKCIFVKSKVINKARNLKKVLYQPTQCPIQMYFGTSWTLSAPEKVLLTLFLYIFHVKTKWNIVSKYLKTKIFSYDTNVLPQMHWISNIFEHSATTIGGFWVPLNYLIVNFKKKLCRKKRLDAALQPVKLVQKSKRFLDYLVRWPTFSQIH